MIANDIYYQLTQQGHKVFYAPISLEDILWRMKVMRYMVAK